MRQFFCECVCGCFQKVEAPFGICSNCKVGRHQYQNLNLAIRRECESCQGGSQVYDRSSCSFVCDPDCPDFGRQKTLF